MSDSQRDLSAESLIAAIEANLFAFMPLFRKLPRIEVHQGSAVTWSISDLPFPDFNSVIRAQLPAEEIDTTIQSILAQARTRNVPLLWWIGPSTRPADLDQHLKRHGFANQGHLTGMALELARMQEIGLALPGLSVRRVEDDRSLKLWSEVCAAGFGIPDLAGKAYYEFMTYMDADTAIAYIGWLNDQPVATSLLMLAAGVAGIYNVATISEARRQGIGALMTSTPLRDARERGYNIGVLHSSDMAIGVYRSLGFREYCTFQHYVWLPEQDPAST
ncbi:MAG TPA: GNAT family N-acetyltransferase [Roseiflexaceae bacterium]|nr:GNAT family N-acetyltransferase [Roseiflexaceae bacterium]